MNELTLTKELDGLSESKAKQIKAVFQPMVEMLESFEATYNDLMSTEQTQDKSDKAKRLRLVIAKVRINADKVRKSQKEEYLRAGNAIQGIYNVLKFAVADKEEKLKKVETFYERIEEERVERLNIERITEVQKYDLVGQEVGVDFGVMANDVWLNYISGVKLHHNTIKEAERKAEEERIEVERKAEEAQAKIKLENEKLKAEQEIMKAEMREREAAINKERKEREERERIMQEQEENKAEEKRKLELAPDKEKLLNFAGVLFSKKDSIKSKEAKEALSQAINILAAAANKMG